MIFERCKIVNLKNCPNKELNTMWIIRKMICGAFLIDSPLDNNVVSRFRMNYHDLAR
jgi:hypothetical protein